MQTRTCKTGNKTKAQQGNVWMNSALSLTFLQDVFSTFLPLVLLIFILIIHICEVNKYTRTQPVWIHVDEKNSLRLLTGFIQDKAPVSRLLPWTIVILLFLFIILLFILQVFPLFISYLVTAHRTSSLLLVNN